MHLICPELVIIVHGGLVDSIYASHRPLQAAVIDGDVFNVDSTACLKCSKAQAVPLASQEA